MNNSNDESARERQVRQDHCDLLTDSAEGEFGASDFSTRVTDVPVMVGADGVCGQADCANTTCQHTVKQFVGSLLACDLVSPDRLQIIRERAQTQMDDLCDPLVRTLIDDGVLTPWQATQILAGRRTFSFGKYTLLDDLGQGGMGTVYKARHRTLDRLVALKVMNASLTSHLGAVGRFRREILAAARLVHPNIVHTTDADEADGQHYLVMEYVEGDNLATLVHQHGPLPVDAAIDCILRAARGLQHAHEHGIVHRDVKPGNLLLDRSGTVKVLDLGLARFEEAYRAELDVSLTEAGSIMGTIDYMSPEQALDTRSADVRSDVYSLGCTLHYLLTGAVTYPRDTVTKRLVAHREEPIPSLPAHIDLPGSEGVDMHQLNQVFQKMIAKKPEDRYCSMGALIADLEPCRRPQASDAGAAFSHNLEASKALSDFAVHAVGPAHDPVPIAQHTDSTISIRESAVDTDADTLLPISVCMPQVAKDGASPPNRRPWLIGGLFAAPLLLGIVVITIINRDGSKTTITIPDARHVDVEQGGKVLSSVDVPGDANSSGHAGATSSDSLKEKPETQYTPSTKRSNRPLSIVQLVSSRADLGSVSIHGNTLQIDARNGTSSVQANPKQLAKDVSLRASIHRLDASPQWGNVGFLARQTTDSWYAFAITTSNTLQLCRQRDGVDEVLSESTFPLNSEDEWYDVEFSLIGSEMRAKIGNDTIVQTQVPVPDEAGSCSLTAFHQLGRFRAPELIIHESTSLDSGVSTGAFALSTNGGHVSIPSFRNLDSTVFTVEAVASIGQPPDHLLRGNLFHAWEWNGDQSRGWILKLSNEYREDGEWDFFAAVEGGLEPWLHLPSNTPLSMNEPTHLAVVVDPPSVRFYVDGHLANSREVPLGIHLRQSDLGLCIGSSVAGEWDFHGSIDELRISSAARYTKDFTPIARHENDEQTLALYHCDEGSGTTLYDTSGNGHHGRITGATWVQVDAP